MTAVTKRIKLLIVDDHSAVRDGLATLIGSVDEFEVVGEACDGVEALDRFRELEPDLVLMDLAMPRMGGVEAMQKIRELDQNVRVVALTAFGERAELKRAEEAGAAAILLKTASLDRIVETLRSVGQREPSES